MVSWYSIVAGFSFVALAGCAVHAALPSYSTVPDFTLTDETGAVFNSAEKLKNTIWIADFIYTTCPGPCPRMSSQMHQVQEMVAKDGVKLFLSPSTRSATRRRCSPSTRVILMPSPGPGSS